MAQQERFLLALQHFDKALARLHEVLAEPIETAIVRDALIQRFEFTFEAAWKAAYRWLRARGNDVDEEAAAVIPEAFARRLIADEKGWGDMRRFRNKTSHTYDEALAMLGSSLPGRSLQIACVYGDLTPSIVARVPAGSSLTVVDVLPQQLAGLRQKLSGVPGAEKVEMVLGDSSALPLAEQSFDRALLFFLLHEQPEDVRRGTLAQAIEVLKPGGRLVVVDYHRAHGWHPLHWPMKAVLATLEPYALDLWRNSIEHFMPEGAPIKLVSKRLHFAGLYQLLEFERL